MKAIQDFIIRLFGVQKAPYQDPNRRIEPTMSNRGLSQGVLVKTD